MKRKWPIVFTLAMALAMGSVTVAHAKWGEGRRSDRPRDKQDHARMRERIELIKMWKLTEVLDLDQETAAKLFPLIHDFDSQQQALRKKRGQTIKQMGEELKKDSPDDSVLRPLIEEFKKNETEMVKLRMERLDRLSKVLTDEQIAKMIALIPKFERDVRDLLGEARSMRRDRHKMFGRHGRSRHEGSESKPELE